MRQAYRTIQDVLASPWAASGVSSESAPATDRILRSTKLENGFEKADVVFITDGECELNEAYARELCEKQTALGFTVTGILLDANSPGMEFSLKTFCRNIYRTSELMGDEIVQELVNERA